MKALKLSWRAVAICCVTLTGALAAVNPSFGQKDGAQAAEAAPVGDDAFEQFVSLGSLGNAWAEMDSAAFTDAALQFVEAEHILLRPHKSLKTSQIVDIAVRMATEKGDKDSLNRLAKGLERAGSTEQLTSVKAAIAVAMPSRGIDPSLKDGDEASKKAAQALAAAIQSARVAGDTGQLDAIAKDLETAKVTDAQRTALKKSIAEAKEAVKPGSSAAVAELDRLGSVPRPISEIKPPTGTKPTIPNYASQEKTFQKDLAEAAILSKSLTLQTIDDPLSQLLEGSRAGSVFSWAPNGLTSIFAYVNKDGIWSDKNCGQAAAATVIKFHRPSFLGSTPVKQLENAGLGPDVAFGLGGTSPNRMQSIAANQSMNYGWGQGNGQLEGQVASKRPCIVMLDVANNKAGSPQSFNLTFGFHWTVVYAYDSANYYCTNFGNVTAVPKSKFNLGWNNAVGNTFGISNKFLLIWPK